MIIFFEIPIIYDCNLFDNFDRTIFLHYLFLRKTLIFLIMYLHYIFYYPTMYENSYVPTSNFIAGT